MADVEEGPAARVTDERIRKCLDAVLWATQSADEHTSHVCIALPIMDDVARLLSEIADLRISEYEHRDRCTDMVRELAAAERALDEMTARLAPIAAETREILPIYDGMPDSHIASVPVGFVRAVDAVAAALSHRSVASELLAEPSESGAEPSELGAFAADGAGRAGGEDGGRGAGGVGDAG